MGYCTTYTLQWKAQSGRANVPNCDHNPPKGTAKYCPDCGTPVGVQDLTKLVADYITKQTSEEKYFGFEPDGSSSDSCKWYEHEDDMKVMSKDFPEVLFTLHGEGEESGDIWNKYFLNGKVQVCKAEIKIDKFDPKKLK